MTLQSLVQVTLRFADYCNISEGKTAEKDQHVARDRNRRIKRLKWLSKALIVITYREEVTLSMTKTLLYTHSYGLFSYFPCRVLEGFKYLMAVRFVSPGGNFTLAYSYSAPSGPPLTPPPTRYRLPALRSVYRTYLRDC